jgi:hypothetical protein
MIEHWERPGKDPHGFARFGRSSAFRRFARRGCAKLPKF